MAVLSASQIAYVANSAGFKGDALVKAVAIALAESSGRTDVVNSIGCVGLWQIYQSVHVKANPTWTTEWLKDPQNNAKAAWKLSNGGKNWIPWEVYTNGMYLRHMTTARAAVAGGGTALPGVGTDTSETVEDWENSRSIGDFVRTITSASFWIRVGTILIGAVFILAALYQVTNAGPTIKSAATKAVKVAVTKKVV